MEFHPNELFLLYDPHSSVGKQTRALALSICNHINEFDVIHQKLSPTYWKEIVNLLGLQPDQLLDHAHPDYKSKVSGHDYTMDGWLEVLVHEPYLVKGPIAIFQKSAVFCSTPSDIYKLKRSDASLSAHMKDL